MSSFCGRMKEYQDVSLDRFDGVNLESTVYMLSHKHEDHMVGLASSNFAYRLQTNNHIKLYCSDVTRDLLLADDRFKWLAKSLVVHELEVPCNVPVTDPKTGKEKYQVTMTMIPAGHCLGSVMFLLEGDEGTVLYTGDFRLSRGDISCIEALRWGDSVKRIDSLYIDTTFCIPQAFYIPSRQDCTTAVVNVVRDWITISQDHMIVIHHRASLGYEQLFIDLANYFSTKIHVSPSKHTQCRAVKALPHFTTTDPAQTQIHACKWNRDRNKGCSLPCGYQPKPGVKVHVKVITVSTMWFTQQVSIDDIVVTPRKNKPRSLRACYSFHSSYSEVRDVVLYLKPSRVFSNVIPVDHTKERIQERLNQFLKLVSAGCPPSTPMSVHKLGQQRVAKKRPLILSSSQSNDSDLFDDIPGRAKKSKTQTAPPGDEEENLDLCWPVSQNSVTSNSQPTDLHDSPDLDDQSSYRGSRRDSASDLFLSEHDLTPRKKLENRGVSPSDCLPETVRRQDGVEVGGGAVNGEVDTGDDEVDGKCSQVSADINNGFMDVEVQASRQSFQPIQSGSYGSHVSYVSDLDLVYPQTDDDSDPAGMDIRDNALSSDVVIENGNQSDPCCQHSSNLQHSELNEEQPENRSLSPSTEMLNTLTRKTSEACIDDENPNGVSNSPQNETSSCLTPVADSCLVTEDAHFGPECEISSKQRKVEDKEDVEVNLGEEGSPEVIMLDTEDDEGGGARGVSSDSTVDERSHPSLDDNTTSDTVQVIDLTADDDDDDVISLGVSRYYGDDGDGYHGDSESDDDDSDGIMAESDESFAKASYEKTKTRIKNGRSRRSTQYNGFSSTDSDMDSDITVDSSYKPPARLYPIAGSSHYTTNRLNGFNSTLVDNEVIILDDDPPPNVTVNDIVEQDHIKTNGENCMAVTQSDPNIAGTEKSSLATAIANARLAATIVKLKSNLATPVLSVSVTDAHLSVDSPGVNQCSQDIKLTRAESPTGTLCDKDASLNHAHKTTSAKICLGPVEKEVGVCPSFPETRAATDAKLCPQASGSVGATGMSSGSGSPTNSKPVLTPLTPVKLGL